MHPHLVFDLRQVPVIFAAKVDQKPIVGEFQNRFHDVFGAGRGGQSADAQRDLLISEGRTGNVGLAPGSGKRLVRAM
jgi:hypothetical protein